MQIPSAIVRPPIPSGGGDDVAGTEVVLFPLMFRKEMSNSIRL